MTTMIEEEQKNSLDIITIEGTITEEELNAIEEIIKDTDRVIHIIDTLVTAKNKTREIEDEFGKHLLFECLNTEEIELIKNCTKPLGPRLAKKIIKDYFEYFGTPLPEEELDQFAYMTQNVGVFPLHRGLTMDGKVNQNRGGTSIQTAPKKIQQVAAALNKLKRECGLHGDLCLKCDNCLKNHHHCHKPFCSRTYVISPSL